MDKEKLKKAEQLKSEIVELYLDFAHNRITGDQYYNQATQAILLMMDEVYPNTEAGGVVFCGKCGTAI